MTGEKMKLSGELIWRSQRSTYPGSTMTPRVTATENGLYIQINEKAKRASFKSSLDITQNYLGNFWYCN